MNATLNGDIVITENNVTLKNVTINGSVTVKGKNVSIIGCTVISEKDAIISYDDIPGAIYVNGCMNIDISDNRFQSDEREAIVVKNYVNLTGNNTESIN